MNVIICNIYRFFTKQIKSVLLFVMRFPCNNNAFHRGVFSTPSLGTYVPGFGTYIQGLWIYIPRLGVENTPRCAALYEAVPEGSPPRPSGIGSAPPFAQTRKESHTFSHKNAHCSIYFNHFDFVEDRRRLSKTKSKTAFFVWYYARLSLSL